MELTKPIGDPKFFVVGGGGHGAAVYRALQKCQMPFATGILFDNDVDYQIASELSDHVISAPAFEAMTEQQYETAAKLLLQCDAVIDAGTPARTLNRMNRRLLELAKQREIPIHCDGKFLRSAHM